MSQITPQLTNMWDKSHESWSVKDKKLHLIYANKVFIKLNNLSDDFDVTGYTEKELPTPFNHLVHLFEELEQALASSAPWCRMIKSEGTYLAWLDCRNLDLDDNTLQQVLIQKAQVAVSMGCSFGDKGKGFIRINLGCPRQYLEKAVAGLSELAP
ncbi:aminotransferase class I/II-fold pyridoxal phosphate-dependent enzyme [Xenorhabdus sp. SGI246]|uniref:aminotransferase class I/II-fold pyridoxal phosphate-dependent enzyme n=1 Tax=Xenorhabdus sp. SGI246 TaxID=3158263 RepID=UPI00349F3C33